MTQVNSIRNVVFCGHGSAGKTTIVDHLLTLTGTVNSNPSVDDGTSLCDFDEEEKHHKHSLEAAVTHLEQNGLSYNIIDTPGYPDFIGQAIGPIWSTEMTAITVNAHSGVEVNTRRVFNEAGKAGAARMIVINKMDDENASFEQLVENLREMWGPQCVLFNVPVGAGHDFKGVASVLNPPDDKSGCLMDPSELREPLIESIVEVDEAVMERYFEGKEPTEEELGKLIKTATAQGTLIPIVCCSAKNDIGLTELLETIAMCCPSPADTPFTYKNKSGEEQTIEPDPEGPLVARVFRTRIDPFVQKLSFIRVYSGTLKKDDHLEASTARKGLKMGPLLKVQAEKTEPIDEAGPGQIVAVAKMDELHTNSILGTTEIPEIPFPNPMVGLAVSPKSRGDETKLSGALHKVDEEDPTFRLDRDPQTKELVMTGMSDLHLNMIQEKLKRRDKLEVETKEPKIPFRETIQIPAEGDYRHKKQSGGRGQFGEVHIRMYPLPQGTNIDEFVTKERFPQLKDKHYDEQNNFLWIDSIVGGSIPGNFLPAIEKGFRERMEQGVIAGYQVQDVCVEVHFGKHHPVDSSEAAFKMAGKQVFRKVFEKAKPALLEPVVKLDVTVPEANVGDVYSDMSGRGGRVSGSDAAGGNFTTVHAEVPLREVTTYSRSLSSMTGGLGSFTMDFSHYEPMPANVQQELVAKAQVHEDEDE